MRYALGLLSVGALVFGGCSPEVAPADLAAPLDLAAPQNGVLITIDGGAPTPLSAWYSIFIAPPEGGETSATQMAVTFIDPAYHCDAPVTGSLDALSFGFQARAPGVSSGYILARGGPHLGPITDGTGWAELDTVDDRFLGADGGVIDVAPGGMVTGQMHFQSSHITIDGHFQAPHCAALDFAAAQ
ncbi:MAG: hypothetical protein ACHQ17_04705 [Polyangia bacterium]